MFAEAPQQVARNRLLGAATLPDRKFDLGMQRFAGADDGIIKCPEAAMSGSLKRFPECRAAQHN